MKCLQRNALLLLCVGTVVGCAHRPAVLDAQRRDDVGGVFVSVSSAAPLGDYLRTLGVDFSLSPAEALEIAVPVSQSSLFKAVDALRGAVAVNRSVAAAPTAPTATVPVAASDGALPALSLGGFPSDRQIGIDPVLRYQAATRLVSEVKMLGRALRNAPFDPLTEQAHLVQFNVTVMPHHDAAPYDAYVDLSVVPPASGVRLIPALLNDSVELTQQQWAKNSVRAFNVATTTVFGAIAGALGLNYTNNQLEEVAGYSLNAVTNVGRSGDASLRIRIGAQNQGRYGQRFLTARTHNIYVVVISKLHKANRGATHHVALCTRYDFRRVNGATVAVDQPPCTNAADLVVPLVADDQADFSRPMVSRANAPDAPLTLTAFAADKEKPEALKVVVPAWDVGYLGDLRAVVQDCKGAVQLATLSPEKHGKGLNVSFTFPAAACDVAKDKDGKAQPPQPVSLVIERVHVRPPAEAVSTARVNLPALSRSVNPETKPPAEAPKLVSCAAKGSFVRAESIVIDHNGKGTLQALVALELGDPDAYTGLKPLLPVYLIVEGADAVGVVPSDAEATMTFESRTVFKKSARYAIAVNNAVPNQPIIINFSKYKAKEFVDTTRCTVTPVLIPSPK